tara:strand:+ start:2836 stop:3498 length:663 start_codon:yes stop_codon:yes gene_type:complete
MDYKDYKLRGKVHMPFSPILMEFDMPTPYIDMLNNYGDKISSSTKKSKQLDWSGNLIGNVKQEHKIEDHVWQNKPDEHLPTFFNWMAHCANTYIKTKLNDGDKVDKDVAKKGIKKVLLHNSWLVNSIAGDFNPPHMHNGMLSAAGWLKMPSSVEKDEEREQAGWIEFIHGTPHILVDFKYPIKPLVGKIFFFPSWLIHEVFPFRGKGLRRTISFNLSVEF